MYLGNNTEFVRKVEELIAMWSRQIEQVITESEQIRREADDVGPGAELQYWVNRRNKFDSWVLLLITRYSYTDIWSNE